MGDSKKTIWIASAIVVFFLLLIISWVFPFFYYFMPFIIPFLCIGLIIYSLISSEIRTYAYSKKVTITMSIIGAVLLVLLGLSSLPYLSCMATGDTECYIGMITLILVPILLLVVGAIVFAFSIYLLVCMYRLHSQNQKGEHKV